jgi:antitoxin PrlF
MVMSKLTNKAQTKIPQPVRNALYLREHGQVADAIEQDRVVQTPTRRPENSGDDPFATFFDWDSQADTKAYAGL